MQHRSAGASSALPSRPSLLRAAFVALLASVAPIRAEAPSPAVSPAVGDAAAVSTVTVLQTTDVHGNLVAWDYARSKESDVGLARVATRVGAIRRETANVLLVDTGDTIQGTPIEYAHARRGGKGPDPTMAVMNAMGYDAMAVGNHEFNYGLDVLRRAEKDARFPWLSANTRVAKDGSPAFREYLVKEVGGLRVGLLGLTTPNVPNWEPEANRPGLSWEDPVVTAKRLVPLLRGKERCDAVVVLFHSGLEADPVTGEPNGTSHENRVAALAREVPGIALVLMAHSHRRVPLTRVGGTWVIQPGRWADSLARVDLAFEKRDGRWSPSGVTGALLPSDASVAADPAVAALAAPYHEAAVKAMDETLAEALGDFPADRARLEDSALLDLVNDAQREATGAQLSMTSLLPGGRFPGLRKGPIRVRDLYALYPYENELVVVEVDGATLKAVLEHAATFYGSARWDGKRLVLEPKAGMTPYSYDVVQGASYRIDPLSPPGSRVRDLSYRGRAVEPSDRFTLAVNSYRAQGAGGYVALKGARVVRAFPVEIRELLIDRLRAAGKVAPVVDHNWVLAPDSDWAPAPAPAVPQR